MSNRIERTAAAMMAVMAEYDEGEPVYSHDLYVGVAARGENPDYIYEAAKWLRDSGVCIVAQKARQYSNWRLYQRDSQGARDNTRRYGKAVLAEQYSRAVTVARGLYYIAQGNMFITSIRDDLVATAISHGKGLSIDMQTVIEDCKPVASVAA